jgi:hypothetical protein
VTDGPGVEGATGAGDTAPFPEHAATATATTTSHPRAILIIALSLPTGLRTDAEH